MCTHRIAEARDIDTEELELCRHVGGTEFRCTTQQSVGDDLSARVSRPHQAIAAALDRGDLADREDAGISSRTGCVGQHATPLGDGQSGLTSEFVTGSDTGGEDDHAGVDDGPVAERDARSRAD